MGLQAVADSHPPPGLAARRSERRRTSTRKAGGTLLGEPHAFARVPGVGSLALGTTRFHSAPRVGLNLGGLRAAWMVMDGVHGPVVGLSDLPALRPFHQCHTVWRVMVLSGHPAIANFHTWPPACGGEPTALLETGSPTQQLRQLPCQRGIPKSAGFRRLARPRSRTARGLHWLPMLAGQINRQLSGLGTDCALRWGTTPTHEGGTCHAVWSGIRDPRVR
jgi:hypothetical protein